MRGPALLAQAGAAACVLAGVALGVRDSSQEPDAELIDSLLPKLRALSRGDVGEPLIPALRPPDGLVYNFTNKAGFPLLGGGGWCEGFTWTLDSISDVMGERVWPVNQHVATVGMKCAAQQSHMSQHVFNAAGEEIFKIRSTHHRWTPMAKVWSFRVLPPESKNDDDAIFTINKDYWKKMGRDIWRVWRGRKKHMDMLYFGVSSAKAWKFDFCRSEAACQKGSREVLGHLTSNLNFFGPHFQKNGDKWGLKVMPGGDPALLLAVSTVVSLARDVASDNLDFILLEQNASVGVHQQPSDGPDQPEE